MDALPRNIEHWTFLLPIWWIQILLLHPSILHCQQPRDNLSGVCRKHFKISPWYSYPIVWQLTLFYNEILAWRFGFVILLKHIWPSKERLAVTQLYQMPSFDPFHAICHILSFCQSPHHLVFTDNRWFKRPCPQDQLRGQVIFSMPAWMQSIINSAE